MAWGAGKSPILKEVDKQFVDRIMAGEDKYVVFAELYPDKIENRTQKQIAKSIRDILEKKRVKEYKDSLETHATEALEEAIANNAKKIAEGLMTEEELMLIYSNIAKDEEESTGNRLRALDSLAKYCFGLDKKKLEVDGELDHDIVINIVDDSTDDSE